MMVMANGKIDIEKKLLLSVVYMAMMSLLGFWVRPLRLVIKPHIIRSVLENYTLYTPSNEQCQH